MNCRDPRNCWRPLCHCPGTCAVAVLEPVANDPCITCGGRGEVQQQSYDEKGNIVFVWVTCNGCGGKGVR